MMGKNDLPKLEDIWGKSEDELLGLVGSCLLENERAALPPTLEEAIESGRRWIKAKSNSLADAVCANESVRKLSNSPGLEQELAIELASLIASVCFNVSPVVISVLLMRKGVSNLCRGRWPGNQESANPT